MRSELIDPGHTAIVTQECQGAVIGPDGKETAAAVAIKYGAFIQTVIDFTIITPTKPFNPTIFYPWPQ